MRHSFVVSMGLRIRHERLTSRQCKDSDHEVHDIWYRVHHCQFDRLMGLCSHREAQACGGPTVTVVLHRPELQDVISRRHPVAGRSSGALPSMDLTGLDRQSCRFWAQANDYLMQSRFRMLYRQTQKKGANGACRHFGDLPKRRQTDFGAPSPSSSAYRVVLVKVLRFIRRLQAAYGVEIVWNSRCSLLV